MHDFISIHLFVLVELIFIVHVILDLVNVIIIKREKVRSNYLKFTNQRLILSYDNIRSFRHDSGNLIQAICGYIQLNDMEGLKKFFRNIKIEVNDIKNSLDINNKNINNPAIYNLINNKYILAQNNGIRMIVNSKINLKNLNTSDYNICRILGIFLDNAIEATKQCKDRYINVSFEYDFLNKRTLMKVENTYLDNSLSINDMYTKGVTSKKVDKKDHGLGLWKVKQIIKFNKNLQIYTYRDKLFKQQLEIY